MVADGWLIAVMPGGLVAVGPSAELNIALDRPLLDPDELLRILSEGGDADQLARASALSPGAAADLLGALREAGALLGAGSERSAGATAGHSLRSAIVEGPSADGSHEIVWTAEEALLLPHRLNAEVRAAALNAFVAGIEPFDRLRAYSQLLCGFGEVAGDRPAAELLTARLAEYPLDPGNVAVIELIPGGREWHSPVEDFELLDASEAHRLGPIARIYPPENFAAEGLPDLHFTVAEISEPDIARASPAIDRRVQGSGSREHSDLTARAEGAERFALAAHSADEYRTAALDAIESAIDPGSLFAYSARQLRDRGHGHGPAHHGERLWCAAQTLTGERRWVPAELSGAAVNAPLPTTSSGVAAHTDLELARSAALGELIERDAFMWTWIQRVSRERVAPSSVPADVTTWSSALAGQGWTAHWVNLTMELQPTILCCLVHTERGLVLGAASRPDAAAALRKATLEALVLALRFDPTAHAPVPLEEIRTPVDHLMLHMDPRHVPKNDFLYASEDFLELPEIEVGVALEEAFAAAGLEPVLIDLTIPRSQPFHVVRAAAPGLAPLSFGWDSEPLGLEILRRARPRHDGAMVGATIDLSEAPALYPHPFA